MFDYTKINSETWDSWAADGCEYTLPISHEEYEKTTADNFAVVLTPCITVPHEWFGELKGKKVLGLATGDRQLKNCEKADFLLTKGKCSAKIPFAAY